jgi:hypothetical protein
MTLYCFLPLELYQTTSFFHLRQRPKGLALPDPEHKEGTRQEHRYFNDES